MSDVLLIYCLLIINMSYSGPLTRSALAKTVNRSFNISLVSFERASAKSVFVLLLSSEQVIVVTALLNFIFHYFLVYCGTMNQVFYRLKIFQLH